MYSHNEYNDNIRLAAYHYISQVIFPICTYNYALGTAVSRSNTDYCIGNYEKIEPMSRNSYNYSEVKDVYTKNSPFVD